MGLSPVSARRGPASPTVFPTALRVRALLACRDVPFPALLSRTRVIKFVFPSHIYFYGNGSFGVCLQFGAHTPFSRSHGFDRAYDAPNHGPRPRYTGSTFLTAEWFNYANCWPDLGNKLY